jgi:polysaccharide deacetylase 2 family uncharacterized protein YibQ
VADSRGALAAPSTHSDFRFQSTKHSLRAVISGLRSPVDSTGVLTPDPKAFMPEGSLFDRPGGTTPAFVAFLAIALIFLAGCGKKSPSKTELRAVTDEVVSAAQRVTGRKSEITIRPEIQPPRPGAPASLAADNIYISLAEPSQAGALRQALAEIARRHKLSIVESLAGGIIRFDFSRDGVRTHAIHVVTPLAVRARPVFPRLRGNPQLAIILDDMGHDRAAADSLLALPFPLTISILPHLPLSAEVAEEAHRRGDEILLHLPMEPEAEGGNSEGVTPEEIELRVGMNPDQVKSALEGMLETVPHAAGVNNHQGSRATADPALMQALMPALRDRNLFFIDSRTTAATVAYDAAERAGVPAASRKVFLDDVPSKEAILAQLQLAARDASRDGSAIAIGHPRPATIAALAQGVPALEAQGIHLVFASELVR